MVIRMPEEFEVPAEGSLPYKKWTIDPGFTEDKWVQIAEGLLTQNLGNTVPDAASHATRNRATSAMRETRSPGVVIT